MGAGRVGQVREGAGGLVGPALGDVEGGTDAVARPDEITGTVAFVGGDAAGQKRSEFGGDVFFGEGVDHGKRVDALEEVVAGRLSEFFVGGDDVEDVVDDLEGHAVGEAELGERFDNRARQFADDGTDAAGRGE